MRNKYKNKIISTPKKREIITNDKTFKFNSTINDYKDININNIFIKKQLIIPNDINIKTERIIPSNNNDLKLYKHVQIRKKLYPQLNELLSPIYENIIQNVKTKDVKSSFSQFNNKYKKLFLNTNSENESFKLSINDNQDSLLKPIPIKKKKYEIININENITPFNKTMRNKNNPIFNYVKKRVIYHGKNNSIINISKNKNIKNIENKPNLKRKIKIEKYSNYSNLIDKSNKNYNFPNHIKIETNSFLSNNYGLKYQKRNEDKINKSKTLEINNEDLKNNITDINNYQITETSIPNQNILNTENNNIKQSIAELYKDNEKGKEKRRYVYINRKIRNTQNKIETKNEKEKIINIKLPKKINKKIEIQIENNNTIKIPSLIQENINNNGYSLTEKKREIFGIFRTNKNSNSNYTEKHHDTDYKTKSMLGKIKPLKSLKFLMHKAHEFDELGDSFWKFYSSGPNSARNSKYKTRTQSFNTNFNNTNIISKKNKLETLSDLSDINNISSNTNNFSNNINISQKYIPKNEIPNLKKENKIHSRQYSNINENENNSIDSENKIINNNTFNTMVNFYKINEIPSLFNSIDEKNKNSLLLRIKNKFEHKRASSENSSHSNTSNNSLNKTQHNFYKGLKIENNDNGIENNTQYANTEENQTKKYEIDLEILFILEEKLKSILNKVNNYTICYNECFDWVNYYFNINFYDKEINLFKLNRNKNNVMYYIKIELLCHFLCYDVSLNKNFNQAGILLKAIFNILHINYLILISYIIYDDNNIKTKEESNYLKKIKEIINNELKLKLNSQDMNENSILLLISNNFKEINNYYKMIIDNLYSYYYSINDEDDTNNNNNNKFPNCLTLNVNTLNNIQKLKIISSFFFDIYKFSNNYNFKDLKKFFDLYLYKSKERETLMPFDNLDIKNDLISVNINKNNNYSINNDKYNTNNSNNIINSVKLNEYYLPPIKPYYKYTLVLDLDETLVYLQKDFNLLNNNYIITKSPTLIFRPGLLEFLQKMKSIYELILFSFGRKQYVDYILSIIEKKEKIFEYVLYREHASYEKGDYVKNLSLLGRDLKKVIIIDDFPNVFKLQKNNGICIRPFYGDVVSDRNTLKILGKILEKIRFDADENDGDIRKSLKKHRNYILTNITNTFEN